MVATPKWPYPAAVAPKILSRAFVDATDPGDADGQFGFRRDVLWIAWWDDTNKTWVVIIGD